MYAPKIRNVKAEIYMIKRILSLVVLAVMVLGTGVFTACKKVPENYAIANVSSNGGIGVVYNGYVYYVGGGTTTLEDPEELVKNSASIYKLEVDAKGNPVNGAQPIMIYSGVAGFSKGELFIFGEHLYFAEPSSKISNTADKLVKRTTFARIDLNGGSYKELYTTESEDNITYEYYQISDTELRLVVLEGTELYSLKIGKKVKKTVIDEDVTSATFTSTNGTGENAEKFVFYTKAPSKDYLTQKGVMVYKVLPTGENKKQISSGEDVKLLKVEHGYLYYSLNKKIYRTTSMAGLDKTNIVSYNVFKSCIFLANGGVIGVDENASSVVYVRWNGGNLVEDKLLMGSKDYTLMFVEGDYLFALNSSNLLYRVDFSKENSKITADKVYASKIVTVGGALTYEKIGGYIYTFVEKTVKDANGNDVKLTELVKLDAMHTVKETT